MLLFGAVACTSQSDSQRKPAHLVLANAAIETIAQSENAYIHSPLVLTVQGYFGSTATRAQVDCSGFQIELLRLAYRANGTFFETRYGKTRPQAVDFFTAIQSASDYHERYTDLSSVRAGDIMAIQYANAAPGDNTGHLVMFAENFDEASWRQMPAAPVVASTRQYAVQIIDASSSRHGPTDTRGAVDTGIGRGVMRIYTASDSTAVVGYTWSTDASSVYYDNQSSDRHIALGRYLFLPRDNL